MVIIPPAYNAPQTPPGDYIGFVKPLEGKGIMFLYELADRMPERKFLVLRGEWQSCETIIEKPNVTFINPVDDMDQFYSQVRITLMPSLSEDAGTIPQESAAHGLPCISSNVMGLPETNIGGIILPHDLNSWVDAIRQLDMENYYKEVVHREQEGLAGFAWEEKFDDLSRRINQ
jgi:glycosyltransferase involved in cell wall biosynthesis